MESIIYAGIPVILGGLITYAVYLCNQQKLKKKMISICIQEIDDLAAQYWCSVDTVDSHYCGIDVQQKLHALREKIDLSKPQIQDAYIEYRQVITSDNLDSPSKMSGGISESSLPDENLRVLLIREKSKNLKKALKI